jgi:DNA-binding IclR family transcriptional regulator
VVNHKKVQRLWREEGLRVSQRRRRKRHGTSTAEATVNADAPNRVWAVDFQFDVTTDSPAQLHSGAVSEANDPRQGIQSVELAMTIIEAIERGLGPMSLTQIAKASGMAPSKAHRYLVSLSRIGLIAQSKHSGLYDLGPAMRRVGVESLRRMDEVGLVSEHLPELRDRTSHAVNLAVWGDHGPVLVRWAYGSYALPITVRVGATMPLLTSSVGRVYLAYLPESLTLPVLQSQLAADPNGIPSADELTALREEVRRRGVAETSGGVIPGVTSLAAPVFPAGETIPLVIALALPAALADTATMTAIEAELLHTIDVISNDLGSAQQLT